MSWLRTHRVISWVIAGYVSLVLFAFLAGGADSSPPAVVVESSATATSASTPLAASGEEFERPNFEQQDCRPWLTTEEIDQALGETNWVQIAEGESCLSKSLADSGMFVQIGPGHPNDFQAGAELIRVTGEGVSGVGDLALWFGGPEAQGDGTVGALVVAQDTPLGALIFRIVVSRPDLESVGQLDVAKILALSALPRFPGVEPPPPPARAIPQLEPLDTSSYGYVENLLEKEADGEWTLGEGLVATLKVITGGATPADVLRDPQLVDFSSKLISMARAYIQEGEDTDARAEVTRLLDRLVQLPSESELADLPPVFGRTEADQTRTLSMVQEGNCTTYIEDSELCWGRNNIDPELYGLGTYLLMGPDQAGAFGWTKEHVELAQRAMSDALATFHGLKIPPPPTILLMLPTEDYGGTFGDATNATGCIAYMGTGIQSLNTAHAEQAVAGIVARCSLLDTSLFAPGSLGGGAWSDAGSWFLSDVVYPDADFEVLEISLATELAGVEIRSPMLGYDQANWAFLEDAGIGAALDILKLPVGDLSSRAQEYHDHTKRLTEGAIVDRGGAHGYSSPKQTESLSSTGPLNFSVAAFQALRLEVSVDGGDYACVSITPIGSIASWSPSAVGDAGSWSQAFPQTLDGTSTFIATSSEGGQLTISVKDFVDDPEDCDEEKESEAGGTVPFPPCGFCDASSLFWNTIVAAFS